MYKLLFVVHRYYPYPGGSEKNVQRLAEEAVRQGHDVTVLTDQHHGDHNGVKVTSDRLIAFEPWDLIIVHGSCPTQDFIHVNSQKISEVSPIYYMLIEPSEHAVAMQGMRNATYIGCGTSFDMTHVKKHGLDKKARVFRYGIDESNFGNDGFRERYGITTEKMYLSVGGFWPHKRHAELAETFRQANVPDTTLVLMGYDAQYGQPPKQGKGVITIMGASDQDVYDAMYAADLYILNSVSEGYGLVLLEAMYNYTPWIARPVAAGFDLAGQGWGELIRSESELIRLLRCERDGEQYWDEMDAGHEYVLLNHMSHHSLNSILEVLQ